jgi:pimeloyl-ACP methyl ester carboxylesterase
MPDVAVNGVRLAYDDQGSGETVVLVCGLSQPAMTWQLGMAPALVDAGYRVVTFDNRGVPPSDTPPPPYSVDDLAADTAGLIEALDLAPAHVAGYSLGSWIAEVLAWKRPELLRSASLIAGLNRTSAWEKVRYDYHRELVASGTRLPAAAGAIELLTYLPNASLQDDDIVSGWLALLEGMGGAEAVDDAARAGLLGQWDAAVAWTEDTTHVERWADIAVPTLVLAFEHDIDSPPRHAEAAAAQVPGARFVELPGLSHLGPLERPDLVVPVLADFIASVP